MAKDIYHKPTSKKQIISNLSKFIKIIDDSELSNNDKKLFKEMADKGIFIHYSGVPYKLRKWIEDSFKIEEEENVYKILFATETLFYGVNISTDCVILSKLKWPRDDPGNFTFEHLYLTPSEYHNILGRAGRPNHTHKCLHAYICVHAKEFDNDDIEQIINYYKGSIEARSKLFLDSDQQHYADKTITHLDDVSYPAFRSIIDAIRYLEFDDNTVTEADIKALLRKTVFYNNDSEEFISGILATIIEQSKKYKFNNTTSSPLLRTEGRGYKITQQAESLIVTGTHWRSIAPMYSWLFKLNKFNKEEDYSIETIIPALIAAPDLWKTLKQFCAEQEKKWEKEEPTEGLARNNEEYYSDILRSELLQIFNNNTNKATAFIELIDHYIDEQESILQVYQYKFRKAMFLKLMSAFLKWLRGEEMDAISQLSILYNKRNPTKDTDNNLQTKYVEKANWLSIMMLNFFVDIPDILTKSQIRELPTLSLRLRYGVVSEAIPYIGGFDPSENRLDRKDIRNLMDNHITPNDLIKKKNLDSNFSSELISKASNNVIRFHKQQISELAETFSDEGYDYWYRFSEIFREHLENKNEKLNITNLIQIIHSLITLRSKIKAIIQTDEKSIKIQTNNLSLCIYIVSNDQIINNEYPCIIIRFPWILDKKINNACEIGVCCGMVLATFIGRDFIKISELIKLIQDQEFEYFNIKKLVTSCNDFSSLPKDMLEKLLQFIEL